MKRFILIISALLFLNACSKEETPADIVLPEWKANTLNALPGSWHGELYSETLNVTECEDLTFTPFQKPREIVSLFGTFTAYGTASVKSYFNDNSDKPAKDCLYTVGDYLREEGGCELSFFRCDESFNVTDKEDKRILTFLDSPREFLMRHSGLTPQNNLKYTKQ